MKRRSGRVIPWLVVGALIAGLAPTPAPLPAPTPAEAQVGGSTLPDTTRLVFRVFKVPRGQREWVSYVYGDTSSCDSCTSKDLTVWGTFKNTGSWAPGGTSIPVFAGGSSASSFTANQYIWYDATLKKLVASGSGSGSYQPLDAQLTALAKSTSGADLLPYFSGASTATSTTFTSWARSILDDANQAATQSTLGLVPGADIQAYDADLTTFAGITPSANVQTMLGSANNATIVSNIGAQPADTDLDDLADGSLSGSRVGSGIDAANITTGNLPIARVTSTDGAGSNLDADLLDGLNTAAAATASTVMTRDANGRSAVAEPSASTDIATKNYVDTNAGAGKKWTWITGFGCAAGGSCGSIDTDSYTYTEILFAVRESGAGDGAESNFGLAPRIGPTWKGAGADDTMLGMSATEHGFIMAGSDIAGTRTAATSTYIVFGGTTSNCEWQIQNASTNIIEGFRNSGTCDWGVWGR